MFLEHVNLTVSDVDRSARFYEAALGLKVRWKGVLSDGRRAVHVGDERHYLALFETPETGPARSDYRAVGVNHFGFVVNDLEAMKTRLVSLGTPPISEQEYEPGRRLYFLDPDGVEVELVEYDRAR